MILETFEITFGGCFTQGLHEETILGPGSGKGGDMQKWYKIDTISTLEPTLFLNRLFHRNWMTSALKKHDLLPEFSSEVPFWSISYKVLLLMTNLFENELEMSPKTIQNPSQKRSWTLSRNWWFSGRASGSNWHKQHDTPALDLLRKGRGNGEGLPKTPSSFLGKIGGLTLSSYKKKWNM